MRSACLPRHPAVAYLCLVSSTKMHPTPEQIRQALPHIRYEIESFLQTPAHDSHNEALQESVYFRKMAHCRALYHFFRKPLSERQDRRKKVDDDVLSEDYGFQAKDVYGEDSATLLNRLLDRPFPRARVEPVGSMSAGIQCGLGCAFDR